MSKMLFSVHKMIHKDHVCKLNCVSVIDSKTVLQNVRIRTNLLVYKLRKMVYNKETCVHIIVISGIYLKSPLKKKKKIIKSRFCIFFLAQPI